MKFIIFLCMLVGLFNPVFLQKLNLLPKNCGRFKGKNSTSVLTTSEEFPWIATLIYYDKKNKEEIGGHVCGGVLINDRYVLTAGHCVLGDIQNIYGYIYKVRLGVWDLLGDKVGDKVIEVQVEEVVLHPEFLNNDSANSNSHRVDNVALLRLMNQVNFNDYIWPICVPMKNQSIGDNDHAVLSGWGVNYPKTRRINKEKIKENMTIYEEYKCVNDYYNKYNANVTNKQICAKSWNGKSCFGIGGEPLMNYNSRMERWYLQGIVSHGPIGDLCDEVPDIYSKISEYYNFIISSIRE